MDGEIFSLADKVIETLKQRKILEFEDLIKEVQGDKKTIKRITELLERQGMVSIEYKLTKVIIAWNDTEPHKTVPIAYGKYRIISMDQKGNREKREAAEIKRSIPAPDELPFITKEVEFEEKKDFRKGKEKKSEKEKEKERVTRHEPEVPQQLFALRQARERELERQRVREKEISKIETAKAKGKEKQKEYDELIRLREIRDIAQKGRAKLKEKGTKVELGEGKSILREYLAPRTIDIDERSVAIDEGDKEDEVKQMAEELKEKLKGIQIKKAEVAELNRKKAGLVEEYYTPISQRVETEIMIIADLVADKEQKIKKLKERLKALPERISEIDIDTLELRNIELEAKSRFNEGISELEEVVRQIKTIQKSVKEDIGASKETLNNQVEKLNSLKNKVAQYSDMESDIEKRLITMHTKIEKEMDDVNALEGELETVRSISDGVKSRVFEIEKNIDEGSISLGNVEKRIKNLTKLDELVKETKGKYVNALQDLEHEIAEEETELAKIREIVESGFARKYLSEIEGMRERHEAEVTNVALKEQEINEHLDKAKIELRRLIRQSKELSDKLYAVLPKKSISLSEIDKKIDERMEVIEEREKEKEEKAQERKSVLSDLNEFLSNFKKK